MVLKRYDGLPFQSTPPVKAATSGVYVFRPQATISIHAAREGGDRNNLPCRAVNYISIHAAREGGDLAVLDIYSSTPHFNPRRP